MESLSSKIAVGLAVLAVGQVIALIAAFLKMMHELAFIKGQMTHFVRGVDSVKDLERSVAVLDRAQMKTSMDLNHAFAAVRQLKGEGCNGRVESA
jgi:hypothetical protein